jgi:hypothetical protein
MSNLSLEDFNTNFVTEICSIEEGHTDEAGSFDYGVGFHVLCKPNRRVMYFEHHLSSNILPPGFGESDIVNAAWSNLLPTVKTWAEGAINSPSLLGAVYTPNSNLVFTTASNFTLADYNSNYTTSISRFDTYPRIEPTSWCVGFNVVRNANPAETMYVDTNVFVTTFALNKTEEELLDMAWSNVKENIGSWAESKNVKPTLLSTTYTSSNW